VVALGASGIQSNSVSGCCQASHKEYKFQQEYYGLVKIAAIITRVENKLDDDWLKVWDAAKLWYEVTNTLGKTAAIAVVFLLLLPISKCCFWLDLCNLKFERSAKFHRWLAWFLVAVVAMHASTAIASLL
jgi:hypothetical protein